MEDPIPRRIFDFKAYRTWRAIQVASILPLSMIVVLMIHFRGATEVFIIAFFLVLIVGVLMPQVSGDMILSHLSLKQELRDDLQKLLNTETQKLREQLREELFEKFHVREQMDGGHRTPEST